MGQVVFDIYAYDDPNGSALCRVTTSEAIEMRFRLPEIGFTMADGLVKIHSSHALATAANFHRHNLAKLTWIADDLDETELPFAFFLEEGDFMALSKAEEGGRVLTFTGPNTVQYLDRAILRETPFTTESIPYPDRRGGVNVDGMWTWGADADGREPGPIMVRAMEEGRDQPGAPLGDATWDFDRTNDSDSNPWDATGDEWQVPWGTTILDLLQILMREGGLYWRSGRDLDFHAYNTDPGVDRTSATFTAGKVRFAAGFNIENEVRRAIQGPVERSAMLATGADYATSFVDGGSSDVAWVGHLDASSVAGASRLEIAAQRNLDVRSEIADAAFPLTHIAGENESTGLYVPGIHYVPGDLVRIHTGTNAHDFNEFDINVASAGVFHDEAGNWFGIAELGARTLSAASKAFEDVAGRLNVPHGLELCPIATYITAGDPSRLYFNNTPGGGLTNAPEWDGEPGTTADAILQATPSGDSPGNSSNDATGLAAGDYLDGQYTMTLAGGALLSALQGGGVMRMQQRMKSRSGVGINEAAQDNYLTVGVRIFRSGALFATLLVPGVAIGAVKVSAYALENRSVTATLAANGSITTGDVLVVEPGWHHVGPTSGGTGCAFNHSGDSATDLPEDDSTASAFNPWIQFGGGGTTELVSPGVNSELAGTSIYAARCDHRHHVLRDAEPTVDDDEDAGYPEGTYWVVVDDLDAPTEVLSVWLSLDGSTGAAVWAASGGSSSASLIVEDDDAGVTVDPVSTLQFEADEFTVSDEGGGVALVSLVSPGGAGAAIELDYVGLTAATTTISGTSQASPTDVLSSTSQSYTGDPIIIEVGLQFEAPFSADWLVVIDLYDGSTNLGRLGVVGGEAATDGRLPFQRSYRYTPSAGTHQFHVKMWEAGGTGALVVRGGAGTAGVALPGFIRITAASPLGAWTTYTPTWTASTTPPTLGSTTITGRYKQLDAKTYIVQVHIAITTGGAWNAGSGEWRFGLPSGLTSASGRHQVGGGYILDASTRHYSASPYVATASTYMNMAVADATGVVAATAPVTWATGDIISMNLTLEVA